MRASHGGLTTRTGRRRTLAATRQRASSLASRWKLQAPRSVWVMLPAGPVTESTIDALGQLLSKDDSSRRGNTSAGRRRAPKRCPARHPLHRSRHQRRRVGAGARQLHDDRRRPRGGDAARSIFKALARGAARFRKAGAARGATPRRAGLYPHRTRGSALRQDDPTASNTADAGICGSFDILRNATPRHCRRAPFRSHIATSRKCGGAQRHPLVAARSSPRRAGATATLDDYSGYVRLRRGAAGRKRGDRRGGAASAARRALCPLPLAARHTFARKSYPHRAGRRHKSRRSLIRSHPFGSHEFLRHRQASRPDPCSFVSSASTGA